MTHDEQAFFEALGARIAELRKTSDTTQVQLLQLIAMWEGVLAQCNR